MTGIDFESILTSLADLVAERVSARMGGTGSAAIAPRLLSVEQAAAYIGRTKDSVQSMAANGKLPIVRADRRIFFDRRDLDRWIEDNKHPASTI
jgi:excisionase family DNA binding protein